MEMPLNTLLHKSVPEQSIANLMGCVFWGWKPGTFSGWLSCAYIELDSSERFFFPNNSYIAGNHKNGKGVLTIERSRAVIADPCDRPMTPSYSFFDSSLDHHFTWLHSISLYAPNDKMPLFKRFHTVSSHRPDADMLCSRLSPRIHQGREDDAELARNGGPST